MGTREKAEKERTFPAVDAAQRVSFKLFLFPTRPRYTTMLLNSQSCRLDSAIILRALHKNRLTGHGEIGSVVLGARGKPRDVHSMYISIFENNDAPFLRDTHVLGPCSPI